jgi:uncharacterized protein YbaP (TraB family)
MMSFKKAILFTLFSIALGFQTLQAQLLWEISGNGLEKPSYLYGTIHLSDKRVFNFSPQVLESFETCDAFAGEMLFDQADILKMMSSIFMNDTTLTDLLNEEKYKIVKAHIDKKLGMMAVMADKIKPIFTSVMLTQQSNGTVEQDEGGQILDLYFQDLAKKKNMEVLGLETFEEQMASLNQIPLQQQAEMLYKDITSKSKVNETEKMLDFYTTQNLDSLYTYVMQELPINVEENILTSRNYRMLTRIEAQIKTKSLFIGVGAAHLPGNQGLIDLLRKEGYTVESK